MRKSMTLKNSPKGLGGRSAARHQRKAGNVAMAASTTFTASKETSHAHNHVADHHGYDDGLVHSHRWAMSTDH